MCISEKHNDLTIEFFLYRVLRLLGIYDGRFRTTLKTFTSALEVDWEEIDQFEQSLVEELVKIRSDEEQR